jgi:hypothetical protein
LTANSERAKPVRFKEQFVSTPETGNCQEHILNIFRALETNRTALNPLGVRLQAARNRVNAELQTSDQAISGESADFTPGRAGGYPEPAKIAG